MNLEVGQFCSILLSSTHDTRLIIRGVAFWWECPSIRGTIVPHWKNSQVSVMGVKQHHYQHYSNYVISRQVSLHDGENWSTLTSFKLTKLYHMMYTVHLYTIPNRALARQHTFGYAGFIWYCQAPVIVCCVVN